MFQENVILIDEYEELSGSKLIYQYKIGACQLDFNNHKQYRVEGEFREYSALFMIKSPIKANEKYVSPKKWEKSTTIEKSNTFTLRAGQILVLADDYLDIDSLQEALIDYDYSYRVERVDNYINGLPHLEVYCS